MARHVSSAGLNLIASFEGCRHSAHRDVAGVWTIGYGHIEGVVPGMTISADQAMASLCQNLGQAEAVVDAATSSTPTDANGFEVKDAGDPAEERPN